VTSYGAIASQEWGAAAGPPVWLPDGALAHLDFVNNHYWDGHLSTAGGMLGGGFDAGAIDGSGMSVLTTNANRPVPIGDFSAILTAGLASGFTALVVMNTTGPITGPLISFADNASFYAADNVLESYANHGFGIGAPSGLKIFDYWDLSLQSTNAAFGTGTQKLGLTFSRDLGGGNWRYAESINGEAAHTGDVTYSADSKIVSVGKIAIGWVDGLFEDDTMTDTGIFASITIYAAMDEAALAALTA
jgi:hypothetical protein